jgi:transcription initiation factor TFIIF subunit beta
VENEEFRRISEQRALEALKPKKETVFIDKIPGKFLQNRHALPVEKNTFVVRLVNVYPPIYVSLLISL